VKLFPAGCGLCQQCHIAGSVCFGVVNDDHVLQQAAGLDILWIDIYRTLCAVCAAQEFGESLRGGAHSEHKRYRGQTISIRAGDEFLHDGLRALVGDTGAAVCLVYDEDKVLGRLRYRVGYGLPESVLFSVALLGQELVFPEQWVLMK